MNKDQVIEIMSNRGFTVQSYSMKDTHTVEAVYFITEPVFQNGSNAPAIGCNVFLEAGEFEFMYAVPFSINILRSPKCSPIVNDEHFNKIYSKFKEQACVLHNYFGRD